MIEGSKIILKNGNMLRYEARYPPEGYDCILWGEYDLNGEKTGINGEVILNSSTIGKSYKQLIREDYKKVKGSK